MFKLTKIFTILFALLLFSGGCDKLIYDQYLDGEGGSGGNAPKVFLSVNHGGAAKLRSSSELPDDPTINKDETDYEDWVHDLALFVFDHDTGELVTKYFDEGNNNNKITNSFVIELTPGQRDFYFVANMPASGLSNITDRAGMNAYMSAINTLDGALYQAATAIKGFPMARVYTNQTVSEGGTVYQPAPFKPNGNEDQVLLVRVVAKLEVQIDASEFESVESITLKNAYQDYHLRHGDVVSSVVTSGIPLNQNPIQHHSDITLTKNETKKSFYAYMPEALMTDASWKNAEHKPINYFVITTTSDKTFEVPIITANKDYSFTENYLTYAKSNEDQDKYNIFRNRKYHYQVKNLSDIEVAYKVNEWQYVPTSLYMGYGYNVEVDPDGNIKITNTIDDCMPHLVELKALNGAYFGDDNSKTEVVYGYSSKDDSNFDVDKMKTGYSESFKINNDAVTAGNPYMEVWYNGTKVKTFSKKIN